MITEVALRLFGIPEVIASATCAFETIEGAVDSVIETVQLGIPVARIELLDEAQVRACNSYSQTNLPELPTLFIELHGSEAGTKEQAEALAEITGDHGGTGFAWATSTDERNALWRARHEAYYAAVHPVPGTRASSPTCVCRSPASRNAWSRRSAISRRSFLQAPIVGHVGDGNFHVMLLVDPERSRASSPRRAASTSG